MKLRTATRTVSRTVLGSLAVSVLFMPITQVAHADDVAPAQVFTNPLTVSASGTFSFTTNPGILTTWESAGRG